jgi:hypothetical protein
MFCYVVETGENIFDYDKYRCLKPPTSNGHTQTDGHFIYLTVNCYQVCLPVWEIGYFYFLW